MADTFNVQLINDDNGEIVLPIPVEITDELGWVEGDTIGFEITGEGEVILFKHEEE